MFQQAVSIRELQQAAAAPAIPVFVKPHWWDNPTNCRYKKQGNGNRVNCRLLVKAFLTGTFVGEMPGYGGRSGLHNYFMRGEELWLRKDNVKKPYEVCVAKRINGNLFGNSSSICGVVTPKGKMLWQSVRLVIQETLSECIPMVPFRLFEETGLDISKMRLVERGPEQWIDAPEWRKDRTRTHFMGAMLFEIEGAYFLFDADQNDVKLHNLNVFLSRLKAPASSIKEAYDSLKPQEIKDAERFLGRECPRQGEWFFIPSSGQHVQQTDPASRAVQAKLQAKGNRPHFVEQISTDGFVRGRVDHGGREHAPIRLDGWHKPVGNGAVQSFKISGAID